MKFNPISLVYFVFLRRVNLSVSQTKVQKEQSVLTRRNMIKVLSQRAATKASEMDNCERGR